MKTNNTGWLGLGARVLFVVVVLFIVFNALATVLALVPIPHGIARSFDFPRQQIAVVSVVLLALVVLLPSFSGWWRTGSAGVLLAIIVVQLVWIARFTPLWPAQARHADNPDPSAQVRILAMNVKMSNREFGRAVTAVRDAEPDIAIFIETDAKWVDALTEALTEFEHTVPVPLDNGYGMVLLSKLPLADTQVQELLLPRVPSIHTQVTLRGGQPFRLIAIHPEPPMPTHATVGRDGEIGLVGAMVSQDPLPCVVTGDLNDVGWSSTTRRFQRLSGLLDPRIGRGFYNSFHAHVPFFRWPLDHLFHDPGFQVVDIQRLPDVGSDHFPMLFDIVWTAEAALRTPSEPTADDIEDVSEMVEATIESDRDPIGEDWEEELVDEEEGNAEAGE